jgi:hypothetical protein
MPFVANLRRRRRIWLRAPLPHRLWLTMMPQLLDQTEGEAETQPDSVADDLGRKPIAGEAGASRCGHLIRLLTPVRQLKSAQRTKLTVPKYQTGNIGLLRVAVVEDQLFEISDELLPLRLGNPRIFVL